MFELHLTLQLTEGVNKAISPTFFCRTERLFTFHHFQFPQIAHFIYNMTSYYENHFAISCPSLRYCQRQLAAAGSTSCYRILRIVSDSWQYTWFSQLEELAHMRWKYKCLGNTVPAFHQKIFLILRLLLFLFLRLFRVVISPSLYQHRHLHVHP